MIRGVSRVIFPRSVFVRCRRPDRSGDHSVRLDVRSDYREVLLVECRAFVEDLADGRMVCYVFFEIIGCIPFFDPTPDRINQATELGEAPVLRRLVHA